ncbi:hypothetical protein JVT61DRAFT_10421 [Boletus reticuloceps]|uniref:Uncharacterized protein n=1 Tax=Boletus reticuloceps TaxID=495285 RepID=A0A8I3AC24_9AGAM|nr:hypothetical protein JVT61DRAFT_10421 [Boletus reticuloceps]
MAGQSGLCTKSYMQVDDKSHHSPYHRSLTRWGCISPDICLAGLALYLVARLFWRRSVPLPPGPSGWPLIGNLLDFPTYAPYKTLGTMSTKYGK